MDTDRWSRIQQLYHAALELPLSARGDFISQSCLNDPELRREVESLLSYEKQADELLEKPEWKSPASGETPSGTAPAGTRGMAIGSQLGAFRIVEFLGAGGMGEVYRATDTSLHRDVAIKMLPAEYAQQTKWLARFQREARALASLNHPHIAAVYGLEESDGVRAIAMELVEGPTLADRMARGQIPIHEALAIAMQIAEALEYAHEKGIVHRDLKPANVKLRPDGAVKVLDFGLAKHVARKEETEATETATGAGFIMGTPAYMSPEQAGGEADQRADIWAFGVVLFEMLAGRRIYARKTTSETLAAVARDDPNWDELPEETPAAILWLLRRCLNRDTKNRLRDIGEARVTIQQVGKEPPAAPPAARRLEWFWSVIAGMLLLSIGLLLFREWRSGGAAVGAAPVRVTLELTPAEHLRPEYFGRPHRTAMAFSPDGNTLVFSGTAGSTSQLYRRALDQAEAVPIPDTADGDGPFFSPDGQWLGFYASGGLNKISMNGGPAASICKSDLLLGAAWGVGGSIVFSDLSSLKQVSAEGRTPRVLLTADQTKHQVFAAPEFLPDGKTLLFTIVDDSNWEEAQIAILPPGGAPRVLLKGGASPRYAAAGYLLFMRNGVLLAAPFDSRRKALSGTPVPLLDGIMQSVNAPNGLMESGIGQFAVSRSGNLAYASGGIYPAVVGSLVRLDRQGVATDLNIKDAALNLRFSPDGQRLVAGKMSPSSRSRRDIELYELARGTSTRLTADGNADWPLWSSDGRRILFASGQSKIDSVLADGPGLKETVATTKEPRIYPADCSRDGKWLVYLVAKRQIWVQQMAGPREPRLFLDSKFEINDPEFSPDGRWMVYVSNETGAKEVYVQAFPGPGEKHRISTAGGRNPAWARNGRELFYLISPAKADPGWKMAAVDVETTGHFHAGASHRLFTLSGNRVATFPLRNYDVYPDGQHFIFSLLKDSTEVPVSRLNLVLNWFEELKRRVPQGK